VNWRAAAERLAASRFLRFAFIGALGFLVNEAALWVALNPFGLGPYAGGVFSFLIAATFTWLGNRMLTLRAHAATTTASMLREWMMFLAANGIGFLVNYAVYASLVTFAPKRLNNPFVALAFGTLAGLLFNYVLSRKLVFRSRVST